jgi:hypothetical protein
MDNFLRRPRLPGFHENDRTLDCYHEVLVKNGLETVTIVPIFYFMGNPIDLSRVKGKLKQGIVRYSWGMTRRLVSLSNRLWLLGWILKYMLGSFLYTLDGIILRYVKNGPSTKLLLAQTIRESKK